VTGPNGVTFKRNQSMKIITNEQHEQLLANGRAVLDAIRAGIAVDPTPLVKLHTPDGFAVWLLTELNPHGGDCAYGLCDAGHGRPHSATYSSTTWRSLRVPTTVASSATFTSSPRSPCPHTLTTPSREVSSSPELARRPPAFWSWPYLGNDAHSRGFCGGNARHVRFFSPHFEFASLRYLLELRVPAAQAS